MDEKKYQAPIPPNTLRNADGTPYRADYDKKTLGRIVYEAFVDNGAHREVMDRILGYRLDAPSWEQLPSIEQSVWQQTAEAIVKDTHDKHL